jgi:1-acyl-sn-glycerol-3-phosphate acyltransferase
MRTNNDDRILIRHFFYSIYGWTLFVVINLIQFIFFMPVVWLISQIVDKNKKLFIYLTKIFSYLFFILFRVEKIRFEKNNLKAPKKSEKRIYVINHASQYDVILMYILPGPIKFIFKEKWAKLPLVGWMAAIGGNFILKEKTDAAESLVMFRKASKLMDLAYPFVIYPEGTRSRSGKIGAFFHGSFKLAHDSEADIVPVVFDTWNTIRPGALWIRDVKPAIRILDPIKYNEIKDLSFVRLSNLVRIRMIEGLIRLRDDRRVSEKNYYRKIPQFEQIDNEMREELANLKIKMEKKGISII